MSGRRHARSPLGGLLQMARSPWIVVAAGVVALVALQVVALLAVPGRDRVDAAPEPAPTLALPDLPPPTSPTRVAATLSMPVVPGLSPRRTEPPPGVADGNGTQAPPGYDDAVPPGVTLPPAPPPAPAPPAPAPSVAGRYSKLNDYGDAFIGEVLLTSAASGSRSWTVRLVLPRGRLVTAWIEGAPQGTARMNDGVFTYTSGVDLGGRSSVPLRFHFEHTAGVNRPSSCTVDGLGCSGL
ncbi:cellulose-binding protein [Micromonospora halophytica]|uniref:Cellulose binding domain-containing protein n=1 Tax=Micromonospora halophytica TaxID=47864 RepID=A0A1C5I6D4_9ACTN|nr:cellulose-binding protein [Micromonospora halophytica]SCG53511.1 hypothetical protein GA0070560_10837 [Micromonospora halophytica]